MKQPFQQRKVICLGVQTLPIQDSPVTMQVLVNLYMHISLASSPHLRNAWVITPAIDDSYGQSKALGLLFQTLLY